MGRVSRAAAEVPERQPSGSLAGVPPGPLRAVALACTLTPSPAPSSSVLMARQLLDALREHGVESPDVVRVVDHDVRPGVQVDMGEGDAWPAIRRQVLEADVLVLTTPTWLGQHSSVCQRVLERLDGELGETDDAGRLLTSGKVAVLGVVGNEDGAHHISGILLQALTDVGFTSASQPSTYWNDESSGEHRDYQDLPATPEQVTSTMRAAAANAAHLAGLLRGSPYPPA